MRLPILAAIVLLSNGVCEAQVRDCKEIKDDRERLACFDSDAADHDQADTEQAVTREENAIESTPVPVRAKTEGKKRLLGFGNRKDKRREKQEASNPSYISSTIVAVRRTGLDKQIVELENGQVWMVTEPVLQRIRGNQKVTISQGRFNSFRLRLANNVSFRVHRVK
jgi:hypothetical protein|tara:strand:- start:10427 stop:10927 length:501 start_codon:yes stop_codon:yes gene_type:complete